MEDWSLGSLVPGWSLGLLLLLLLLLRRLAARPALFPPGPTSLPLIGSYPFLKGEGVERFLGRQVMGRMRCPPVPQACSYGPVTGLYIGSYPVIVLNDWPLAKALFAKEEFSGRMR
jgi:hypothetical protein